MKIKIQKITVCRLVFTVLALQMILVKVCFANALWNVQNSYYLNVTSQDITHGYTLSITNEDFTTGNFTGTASHDGATYPINGNTTGNSISWNDPDLLGCGGTLFGSIDTNGVLVNGGGNLSNCGSEWSAIWGESAPSSGSPYAAPSFTLQPISVVCSQGSAVSFTANAVGDPNPTYQWQFNGTNIDGAINPIYTMPSSSITNLGVYDVIASNVVGTNNSTTVSLSFLDEYCIPSLILSGPVGATYTLQMGTSLGGGTNWTTITDVTLTASQPYIFPEVSTLTNGQEFFRAIPQ